MTNNDWLIAVLAFLVILLTILFIIRIVQERKLVALLKILDPAEFSAFLQSNSLDGSIEQITSKVGDLLKDSFGCERIIFLRNKKGILEYNYYYGINNLDQADCQINYTPDLDNALRSDFLPRSIQLLNEYLPETFYQQMVTAKIDSFFPVYWRENLYGVYFIQSNPTARSVTFDMMVASLAHALSTAFHVNWHESQYSELQRRHDEIISSASSRLSAGTSFSRIIRLFRYRDPEGLVRRIVDILTSETGVGELAFLYESGNQEKTLLYMRGNNHQFLTIPNGKSLSQVVRSLGGHLITELDQLAVKDIELCKWVDEMMAFGLKYISPLPLSRSRTAILLWEATETKTMEKWLQLLREHTAELMANAESFEKVEALSFTDGLTGLANQRYFLRRLHEEVDRCRRYKRQLALIFFDMDDLKNINDTYGHLAGDDILRRMGEILRRSIRSIDVVARYGGDEFCVVMPEADETTCLRFMTRLKSEVAGQGFSAEGVEGHLSCTISLGGAVYPKHAKDSRSLIHAADMALLKAKEAGRDACLIYSE